MLQTLPNFAQLLMIKIQNQYEKFQEWLNDCPVEIVNYLDYSDRFEVTFMVNLEEAK